MKKIKFYFRWLGLVVAAAVEYISLETYRVVRKLSGGLFKKYKITTKTDRSHLTRRGEWVEESNKIVISSFGVSSKLDGLSLLGYY